MKLQVGMRVLIKDDKLNYGIYAGTVRTITKNLPDFGGERAFETDDNNNGIWQIEDFEKCLDYPELTIE